MGQDAKKFCFKFFRNVADSADMNVNGAVTPVDFKVTATATGTLRVERINFQIVDDAMGYQEFAGLGSALSNGVEIKAFDVNDVELIDFTDGENIIHNEDFGMLAGVDAIADTAAGNDFMPVRWTISRAGKPLDLEVGEYIRIRIQDNLSAIPEFRAMLQGIYL